MAITVTPSDLKRATTLPPDWYHVEIVDNKEEASSAGDSTNLVIQLVTVHSNPKFNGVPLTAWISEKAPAILGKPLMIALGGTVNEEEGFTLDFQEGALKGQKLRAKVETGEYRGKPTNQVVDFAKAS